MLALQTIDALFCNLFFLGYGHFNIFPFLHLLQEPDKIIDFRFGTFPNKIPDDILDLVKVIDMPLGGTFKLNNLIIDYLVSFFLYITALL